MRYPVTGQIPSGIFLVTYFDRHQELGGMLASWVQQASFEPVVVSLAIEKGRPLSRGISRGKTFVVHVLTEANKDMFTRYVANFSQALKNEDLDVHPQHKVPVIAHLNALICKAVKWVDCGSHDLLLASVEDEIHVHQQKPRIHIRRSGLNY
jgi:flavin reductase (DIM6/NTAB) family NADH-FMN oxidoreductase RutF